MTLLAPSEKSASNWSNWFVITKPAAKKKPGRGQDWSAVAASLAGVVSGIGQGKITGHEQQGGGGGGGGNRF
jgi:uncharacterized membrane protein